MTHFRTVLAAAAVVVAACFATPTASAQSVIPVNYDEIRAVVQDKPEVFRALTSRFIDADTTLTLPELAVVYYGHAFTPAYDPDEKNADMLEAFNAGDFNKAMVLADEALRRNPVSLPVLFKLYGMCAGSELPVIKNRAADLQRRILMIGDLIQSSGYGVMMESPWCVISESDLNEYLQKYCFIQRELERSDIGDEKAVKVRIDGIDDDVILYFDLVLPNNARKKH